MNQLTVSTRGIPSNSSVRTKVLSFCLKHPKMKFTIECLGLGPEIDRFELEREMQRLTEQGVLNKHVNSYGLILYCANKPVQELAELAKA